MKKRIVSIALSTGLLLSNAQVAFAESDGVISPDSELYATARTMEGIEFDLTVDLVDQVLLQDRFAGKRLEESNIALDNDDTETAEALLDEAQASTEQAHADLTEAKASGDKVVEAIEKTLAENLAQRTKDLHVMLERDDLPESAKINITRALNQMDAVVKRAEQHIALATQLESGELTEDEFENELKVLSEQFKQEAKQNRDTAKRQREELKNTRTEVRTKHTNNRKRNANAVDADESDDDETLNSLSVPEEADDDVEDSTEDATEKAEDALEKIAEREEDAHEQANKQQEKVDKRERKAKEKAEKRERKALERALERAEEEREDDADNDDEGDLDVDIDNGKDEVDSDDDDNDEDNEVEDEENDDSEDDDDDDNDESKTSKGGND